MELGAAGAPKGELGRHGVSEDGHVAASTPTPAPAPAPTPESDAEHIRPASWLDQLQPALDQLDLRLAWALAARSCSPRNLKPETQNPGHSLFDDELPPFLAWLAASFGLAPFDLDALLVALAPEIDQRYEAQYAALQGDTAGSMGRTRPSVALTLELLGDSPDGRLAARERLDADGPLLAHGLLRRAPDPRQPERSGLADLLIPDEAVSSILTGQTGLPPRLAACGALLPPSPWPRWLPPSDPHRRGLTELLTPHPRRGQGAGRGAVVVLEGPAGSGKQQLTQAIATEADAPLLLLDLERASEMQEQLPELTRLAARLARFRSAILLVAGLEAVRESAKPSAARGVLLALTEHPGRVILTAERPWLRSDADPPGLTVVPVGIPEFERRRACWETTLDAAGLAVSGSDLDSLASRFRLTPAQVAAAVFTAQAHARWNLASASSPTSSPTLADLFAAARAHSNHGLISVARQIQPRYRWDDIILPPDQRAQLREIVAAVSLRHVVQERWGFGGRLSGGKGLNILFAGPSGTGKTMAAEVIAHELALDLYAIDLSRVVSKYIGETEKNLDRVFTEAEASNAILFFDEADALFGKRSEVKDAHDRYANIETGYLLQKMEEYEGVAILATNLRANLDEAFARRMHALVEFPFPDEELRARIWQVVFPPGVPLGPDVDPGQLARAFKLSGGNIRNVALTAAYFAAEDGAAEDGATDDGAALTMRHLVRAARREYQKLGRAWDEPAGLSGARVGLGRAR